MLGWQILVVDQSIFMKLKSKEEKEAFIMNKLSGDGEKHEGFEDLSD